MVSIEEINRMVKRTKDMEPTPSPQAVIEASRDALEQLWLQLRENDGGYASFHEGWGVIAEEWVELKDELKKSRADRDRVAIRDEAIQLAASALEVAAIAAMCRDCTAARSTVLVAAVLRPEHLIAVCDASGGCRTTDTSVQVRSV